MPPPVCFLSFFSFLLLLRLPVPAASSTPVPPLQWINLSSLITSSNSPPVLKDAAIGYDENSRSLIVFGGESQGGISQSQTYLLNLDELTWSTPSPPSGLDSVPLARSAAIAGTDFAASYRHGFVVIGGKGAQGQALSDVWEYDFINQFWSQVSVSSGQPSPRWGASGGIDPRVPSILDPHLSSPNNTFYLAGGVSGSHASPLSDVWRFNISGTLSSNLLSSYGSWDPLTIATLPAQDGQGGTVAFDQIIAVGGCKSTSDASPSCAQQASYVITVGSNSAIAPQPCPPPRYRPALVPNMNSYSSSFGNQVFVVSGLYNTSLWNDGGTSNQGEIDVLDFKGGTWTRVLPSGDPGTNGKPTFPEAREGAAVIAYTEGLVGPNRAAYSDTIMFGGQDASGNYLSDIWLLRAYNGTASASSPIWSGYGNGQLETGVGASGSGVKMQFPNTCATLISTPSSATTSSSAQPTSTNSTNNSNPSPKTIYNTSIIHKILAPISVALLLPTTVYFRLTLSAFTDYQLPERQLHWFFTAATVALVAYALGIVGLALSFYSTSSIIHSSSMILRTGHGQAGLAFFLCLYGIIPALLLVRYLVTHTTPSDDGRSDGADPRVNSTSEKPGSTPGPVGSMTHSAHTSPPPSPPGRPRSLGPMVWPRTAEGAISSDTESITSSPAHRGFEVLNRPPRNRRPSGSWAHAYSESSHQHPLSLRSLGDVDWLLRRRSLNAVDELDYAMTQFHNTRRLETPATMDPLLSASISPRINAVVLPPFIDVVLHIILHAALLGICIVSLIALWTQANKAPFAVFLAWTVLFYVAIFSLSWFGRPEKSVLSVMIYRLRGGNSSASDGQALRSPQNDQPSTHEGPYLHQPPFRHATREELAHAGPLSITTDDEDDNIDEDTRQRMIEEEMDRRDVSIVTVPRRKLWIANPS